jgi:glycerophosphoryl diester phosphodiesterase
VNELQDWGSDGVLVIGHRGAEAMAPENTWAALQAGYQAGADILEVDVQLTADGQAIVFHDFTLGPKLGDPRWVRNLAWEEIKDLDVGAWFAPSFAGERIPLLADVLDWARGRVVLWIDLKHGFVDPGDDRLETVALDLIQDLDMKDQVIVGSWDWVALARISSWQREIPVAVYLMQRVANPVRHVAPTGAGWVSVDWPQVDRGVVACLQEAGIMVNLGGLFTGDYAEAVRLGTDAVTTTDPGAAKVILSEASRSDVTISGSING